mmetsp:Transcript_7052/g.15818  ORF Transcript_7052/g.15818 Transcript_7052/m.15818 type:complete len:151 (-) Transcript_7052:643-1095(-)
MYAALSLPVFLPKTLSVIPEATIDGVLAFVGLEGILTTQLWKRFLLFLVPPSNFPQSLKSFEPYRVHLFTLTQLVALALCWAVNLSPAGLCVSIVIVLLVPFRERVLPRLFTTHELRVLDGDEAHPTAHPTAIDQCNGAPPNSDRAAGLP